MTDYSARFNEKFMLKINNVCEIQENVVYVHLTFPGSPRKSYAPHTTFLEFQLLFQVPFFVEDNFISKSESVYFSALFHKKLF